MKKPEENPDMRVLKTVTTKSITGKSTLTYQIGATPDNAIHIRITKNTGAGFFNDEWIALNDIQRVLDKCPPGSPITSFLLQPLFKGKSSNSPAFSTPGNSLSTTCAHKAVRASSLIPVL